MEGDKLFKLTHCQEPSLFSTTIAKNISYGKDDATLEEIQKAAEMANCHSFISGLPDGYNTLLGDKHTQLSGGQKVRLFSFFSFHLFINWYSNEWQLQEPYYAILKYYYWMRQRVPQMLRVRDWYKKPWKESCKGVLLLSLLTGTK